MKFSSVSCHAKLDLNLINFQPKLKLICYIEDISSSKRQNDRIIETFARSIKHTLREQPFNKYITAISLHGLEIKKNFL